MIIKEIEVRNIFKIERIDIPENDEETEQLAKLNFRNTAENAYTG